MNRIFSVLLLGSLFLLGACRKEKEEKVDNSVDIDNSRSENLFSDLFKVIDQTASNETGIRDNIIGCIDTIIVDTAANPMTLLIDFGNDNCVGEDGRIRKGQILATFTGRYRDTGSIITVTPQNYSVNGYTLQGTKTITNLGPDEFDNIQFAIQVNGSVTSPNGQAVSYWQSNRTRSWILGSNTITPWDDVYLISGSGSGTSSNGTPYTVNIVNPLRAEVGCPYIVSGIFQVAPQDMVVRTIDFGNGDCNAGFSVTVAGQTFQIGSGE